MTRLFFITGLLLQAFSYANIVVTTTTRDFSKRESKQIRMDVMETLKSYKNAGRLNLEERENFDTFSEEIAIAYEQFLRSKSYKAFVDTKFNILTDEPALIRLKTPLDQLAELAPAEKMLSPYAQTWAYKQSSKNGPNCWHTSMASLFLGWTKHRYMGPNEYSCHLKTHFTPIEKLEKWGDMIAFDSSSHSPVHGLTYLGPDKADPKRTIVFTKNGYAQSKYLFMTLDDVKDIYSPKYVNYYRPNKDVVIDPSEDPNAPCANEMRKDRGSKLESYDAILDYILSRNQR